MPPEHESQSLRGCIEAQRACQDRVEGILDSHRSEQRAVNAEMFRKLDAIRDRLPGETQLAEAVAARPGWLNEVGRGVLTHFLSALVTLAVAGLIGGLAYALTKGWTP